MNHIPECDREATLLVDCANCGTEAMPDAAFCHNCGAPLAMSQPQQSAQNPARFAEQSSQWNPVPTIPPEKRIGTKAAITVVIVILLTVVLLAAAVSQGWIHFNVNPNTNDKHTQVLDSGNYTVTYSWEYMGKDWTLKDNVSAATYDDYRDRPKTYDYVSYVTKDDPVVIEIANQLKGMAKNESCGTAQFVLSFVQNVPYGTDENTTGLVNYPRYPVETLVDGVGDCKDHSTLYVSLMESQALNVSMVLLLLTPPTGDVGHMAAGIGMAGYTGTYFQYDGRDYFYCETTSPGWIIGDMPQQVKGYSVQVLPA